LNIYHSILIIKYGAAKWTSNTPINRS